MLRNLGVRRMRKPPGAVTMLSCNGKRREGKDPSAAGIPAPKLRDRHHIQQRQSTQSVKCESLLTMISVGHVRINVPLH